MDYKFLIQSPYWYFIVAAIIALLYSFFLYRTQHTWSKTVNYILFGLRAVLVFILLFILSEPLLKQSEQEIEKPIVAVLVDNSTSLPQFSKTYKKALLNFNNSVSNLSENKLWEVFSLEKNQALDSIQQINFNQPKTNIQKAIKNIESLHEGEKIAAIAIFSDGIYNQGGNPNYDDYSYPIYTVGLGDTNKHLDLALTQVKYNKIAYLGNKFLISFKLKNNGYNGESVSVNLLQQNESIVSKEVKIVKNTGEQSLNFTLDAKQEGVFHYVLKCTEKKGEITLANNIVHIYIEVVKNKDRILILAQSPHPDVKAINAALNSGQNYDVDVHFVGDNQKVNLDKVNACVLLGIPNKKGLGDDVFLQIQKLKIPTLFIVQSTSDINRLNANAKVVQIRVRSSEFDKVQPSLNKNFSLFGINEFDIDIINKYTPLNIPFANYALSTGSEILLYQKISTTVSNNPLWVINKNAEIPNAQIVGDGLWMWRIQEKSSTTTSNVFDQLFVKTIQLIASKSDKRKFKVTPNETYYEEGDVIQMQTELYDDLNQATYNHEISLTITNEKKKEFTYKYINQENTDLFEVGQFEHGTYNYTARTQVGNKTHSYSGVFTVHNLQLEELTTTANHELLKQLSTKTNGRYYENTQIEQLINDLNNLDTKGKVILKENYTSLINLKWLFVLLLSLISIEWFARKYFGGY